MRSSSSLKLHRHPTIYTVDFGVVGAVVAVVAVEDVRKSKGADEVLRVKDLVGNCCVGYVSGEASGVDEQGMVCTSGMADVRFGSAMLRVVQIWRDSLRMKIH